MSLSCVIVTKNRPDSVRRLVASIDRQDPGPNEIVIVNDGGEAFELNSKFPLRWIHNASSVQSGRSRNLGVESIESEWILMLDDDVELDGSSFIAQGMASISDEKTGLVFPRKRDHYGEKNFEFSFIQPSQLTGELKEISLEEMKGAVQNEGPVLGPMCCFIRREAFVEVGGYDSIYGLGRGHSFREESDFQYRVQRAGWRVAIVGDVFFNHYIQKSGGHGRSDHRRLFWIAHNQVVFARRFYGHWVFNSLMFLFLELPRYAWGNGRFLTLPAGWLGTLAGLKTAIGDYSQRA